MPATWEFWLATEVTGTVAVATAPVAVHAASPRNLGAIHVAVGAPKVKAAGSARLFTGTIDVKAYRANVAAKGTAGAIGHIAIATTRATVKAAGNSSRYVGAVAVGTAGANVTTRITTGALTFSGTIGVAFSVVIDATGNVPVAGQAIPDGVGIAGTSRPPLAEMMAAQSARLAAQDRERDAAIIAIRSRMAPYRDDPEELWLLGLITDEELIAA